MTLDEYVVQAKQLIDQFAEFYSEHAVEPDNWPLDMPGMGDWDEQLDFATPFLIEEELL
jgi:hypothetical protein